MRSSAKAAVIVALSIAVLAAITGSYPVALLATLLAAAIPLTTWITGTTHDPDHTTLPTGFPQDTGF